MHWVIAFRPCYTRAAVDCECACPAHAGATGIFDLAMPLMGHFERGKSRRSLYYESTTDKD